MSAIPNRRLALFDLDHTLISADTNSIWLEHLGASGMVDMAAHMEAFEAMGVKYHAGTLDIAEFISNHLSHLKGLPRQQLLRLRHEAFEQRAKHLIGPKAKLAVERHRQRGDLCVLVTATCSFVAALAARELGFEHLIGTVAEVGEDGMFTGEHLGTPSYREGKVIRVDDFLRDRGERRSDFSEVWVYSDSRNDLPLLEAATHPVAVDPDPTLRQIAFERKWRIESFKIA